MQKQTQRHNTEVNTNFLNSLIYHKLNFFEISSQLNTNFSWNIAFWARSSTLKTFSIKLKFKIETLHTFPEKSPCNYSETCSNVSHIVKVVQLLWLCRHLTNSLHVLKSRGGSSALWLLGTSNMRSPMCVFSFLSAVLDCQCK